MRLELLHALLTSTKWRLVYCEWLVFVAFSGIGIMSKAPAKSTGQPCINTKLHRHLTRQGHTDLILKDIQHSLSGIGVSLSKRVIEEREKR